MIDHLGIVFALVAALGWGLYLVPMKMTKRVDTDGYQASMTLGIFALTVAACLVLGLPFNLNVFGLLAGLVWGVGLYLFTKSVDMSGLATASPIMVGGVIVLSFVWGAFAFGEHISVMAAAVSGIALLVAGAFVVSRVHGPKSGGSAKSGIVLAVVSGAVFGSYVAPLKMSGLPVQETLFPFTLGIMASCWAIFFIRRGTINMESLRNSFVSGAAWNVANVSSLFAVSLVGVAVAFPITQIGVLLPVVIGAVFFKEIRGNKNLLKVFLGATVLLVGAVLLGLSKG